MGTLVADGLAKAKDVLARLPGGSFIVTAGHDGRRAGVSARSVQMCADTPLLIAVSVRTGHWIEPLIRDSRHFCVCSIDNGESLLMKKFGDPARPRDGDPFDSLRVERLVSFAPVLVSSVLAIDCEVVRHLDLEADHELYVGLVLAGRYKDGSRESTSFVLERPPPQEENEAAIKRRRRGR